MNENQIPDYWNGKYAREYFINIQDRTVGIHNAGLPQAFMDFDDSYKTAYNEVYKEIFPHAIDKNKFIEKLHLLLSENKIVGVIPENVKLESKLIEYLEWQMSLINQILEKVNNLKFEFQKQQ